MTRPPARSIPSMGYTPALDGIRAVAVIAVLLYHGDFVAVPGGFLGVEIFFVISGYLITALIDQEMSRTGGLDLAAFWKRRFRRLLPAAWAMILVFAAVTAIFYREEAARYAATVPAGLFYVANWWFIFAKESYFQEVGRPPLLRHLWSLAIEEQFYLVLPVTLMALRHRVNRSQRALGAVVLALWSVVAMAVMFDPTTDPSRVYFGTDTRASGLLLGVALGSAYRPWLWRWEARRAPAIDVAGAVGLAGLVWLIVSANDFEPFVYRGGFLLVDLLTLMVIVAVMHPASTLSGPMGCGPLRAVGVRSYSLYLWHWPVFALLRPGIDVSWDNVPTFVIRMAITVVLAECSYRFIEMPVREGRLADWIADVRAERAAGAAWSPGFLRGAGVATAAVLLIGFGLATAPPGDAHGSDDASEAIIGPDPVPVDSTSTTTPGAVPSQTSAPTPTNAPTPTSGVGSGSSYFVGDSVLHSVRSMLKARLPQATINTAIGRQPRVGAEVARTLASKGALPDNLVVHLGANGVVSERDIRGLVDIVGASRLVFVTVHTKERWGDESNEHIRALQPELGYRLLDWDALAEQNRQWFRTDGTHPSEGGQEALVTLLGGPPPPPPPTTTAVPAGPTGTSGAPGTSVAPATRHRRRRPNRRPSRRPSRCGPLSRRESPGAAEAAAT